MKLRQQNMYNYKIDKNGFYGAFGGAFIPEMLYANVQELNKNYKKIIGSTAFQHEFKKLLKHYVGRPSPLYFSPYLSSKYKAHIYLKREDLNHTGSHKINNTIGQILLARALNKKHIIAETGAGQHGVATATVCAREGLQCTVFMGETDMQRQKANVEKIKLLGAKVIPARSGNKTLKDATNEAIRFWINNPEDTHYLIGSTVGPHPYPDMVARFQSIISKEIKIQLKQQTGNAYPNMVLACVGGGSNAAGAFYHFLNHAQVKLIAAEAAGKGIETPDTAATTSVGSRGIIHGSQTLLMQSKDGQILEPYSISAGLDYPGIGPMHAELYQKERAQYLPITDDEALSAALGLIKNEGIIPALESAHALALLPKLKLKTTDTLVLNLSGRGDKDMETYLEHLPNIKSDEQN